MGGDERLLIAEDKFGELHFLHPEGKDYVVSAQRKDLILAFNEANTLDNPEGHNLVKDFGRRPVELRAVPDENGKITVKRIEPPRVNDPVKVYELPSMRVVASLPPRADGRFVVVPHSDIIATIPTDDRRALRFFDLKSGKELGEKKFFRRESWNPVCDQTGTYVGGFSDYEVQLFAVKPPAATQTQDEGH